MARAAIAAKSESKSARTSEAKPAKGGAESTRERILEVAEELIALHGMEGFQLKDVAKDVGIRPPSIFAHFRSREAVGEAVALRVVEQLGALLASQLDAAADPEQQVRRTVRSVVTHFGKNPAHVRLLLRDLAQAGSGDSFDRVGRLTAEIERKIDAILSRGLAQGTFRKVSARAVLAQVEGAILANIAWSGWDERGRPRTGRSLRRIARDAEELAVAYVLEPTERGRRGGGHPA